MVGVNVNSVICMIFVILNSSYLIETSTIATPGEKLAEQDISLEKIAEPRKLNGISEKQNVTNQTVGKDDLPTNVSNPSVSISDISNIKDNNASLVLNGTTVHQDSSATKPHNISSVLTDENNTLNKTLSINEKEKEPTNNSDTLPSTTTKHSVNINNNNGTILNVEAHDNIGSSKANSSKTPEESLVRASSNLSSETNQAKVVPIKEAVTNESKISSVTTESLKSNTTESNVKEISNQPNYCKNNICTTIERSNIGIHSELARDSIIIIRENELHKKPEEIVL